MVENVVSYIGLGSNLADPSRQLRLAKATIENVPGIFIQRTSSLYVTKPFGPIQDQPDFVNAVLEIQTHLTPNGLLEALQQIELRQGRVRDQHWGPRTLDLDIILYGDQVIQSESLTVPHPGLSERDFVLYPLAEIAPTLLLPNGVALVDLLKACPNTSRIDQSICLEEVA